MEYDAFLSYNRADNALVQILAETLKERQLKIWFDLWEIPPGRIWQDELVAGLRRSKVVVVLIGPAGVGRWEESEIQVALDEGKRRQLPVIPVLLPGGSATQVEDRPFLRQLNWVEFKSGLDDPAAMGNLLWGVTGRRPEPAGAGAGRAAPAGPGAAVAAAAPPVDPAAEAIGLLASHARTTNLTLVLGRSFLDAGGGRAAGELSRDLLVALGLIGADYGELVPPLDLSAECYVTRRDEPQLVAALAELLMPRGAAVPDPYLSVARLLKALRDRPAGRRRSAEGQLILTTNIDTWLERALLRQGISFSRIVHCARLSPRLEVQEYRNVAASPAGIVSLDGAQGKVMVDGNDADQLDELIRDRDRLVCDGDKGTPGAPAALDFGALQQPIVYKLMGSHDVPASCALSTVHHLNLAWQVSRFDSIPRQVSAVLSNSPVIFLGCRILDADFRIGYHTLLRQAFEINNYCRYALWPRADGDRRDVTQSLRASSWDSLRGAAQRSYRLDLLDAAPAPFLERLCAAVESELGGAK